MYFMETLLISQNQCSAVAESAVIGYSHDIKGQGWNSLVKNIDFILKRCIKNFLFLGIYAFVVLKKNMKVKEEDLYKQLNSVVSEKIAKYACPDFVLVNLSSNSGGKPPIFESKQTW